MHDEQLLREALTHAEAAVCIFTAQRRFLAVNARYMELTGYTWEEVATHRAGETLRLSPLNQDAYMELITAGISSG